MQIIKLNLKNFSYNFYDVVGCIGYFDCFHVGHMKLINTVKNISKSKNLKSALISFYPNPKSLNSDYKYILSYNDRLEKLNELELDYYIEIYFDDYVRNLNQFEFINILNKLNFNTIVCGDNFRFSKDRKGDIKFLIENFKNDVNIIDIDYRLTVSTKTIKQLINHGNIIQANLLLGYDFFINDIVEHGKKLGRTIGFPTANIRVNSKLVEPKVGVYKGYCYIDNKKYLCMINYGQNPTFNGHTNKLECYIDGYNRFDLYDKKLKIYFIDYIRSEIKFSSIESLKSQIQIDCKKLYE